MLAALRTDDVSVLVAEVHVLDVTFKAHLVKVLKDNNRKISTLWCQLDDTFQIIVTPQGMELVMVHIEVISQCLKKYRVEYKACYIFFIDTIQL